MGGFVVSAPGTGVMVGKSSQEVLQKAMKTLAQLGVGSDDVTEKFVTSAKPGGQNVNKTATCVCLSHRPSGIVIKSQSERSQLLNRVLAWERLAGELLARRENERKALRQALEKTRRQKRKRSARAKERMLDSKRRQSQKKSTRRPVRDTKDDS